MNFKETRKGEKRGKGRKEEKKKRKESGKEGRKERDEVSLVGSLLELNVGEVHRRRED